MKRLPKVKFKLPTITAEANMLFNFCYPWPTGWDWSDRVYKRHPELERMVKSIKNKKFFQEQCYEYAKKFVKENKKNIITTKNIFQKEWNKNNDRYLKILSDHFEVGYPANRKIIKAFVSIVPICPRDLDNWSFNVSVRAPLEFMREIVAHETLHFLYFKKWLEVFPKTKRKEMDSPFLIWKLSEIITPIILKHHPEIQKIIKSEPIHYEEFEDVKVGNKKLIPHFEYLYKRHLKTKNSFDDFLKVCWNEVGKYKKIINNI